MTLFMTSGSRYALLTSHKNLKLVKWEATAGWWVGAEGLGVLC